MSIHSTGLGKDAPLVCSPKRACELLECGNSHLYELINALELESYKSGKSRRITIASIRDYVDRQLANPGEKSPVPLSAVAQRARAREAAKTSAEPVRRGRGRPRKDGSNRQTAEPTPCDERRTRILSG